MELGLIAGRQGGSLAEEIWARLEILKACCRLKIGLSKYSVFHFV